MDVWNPGARIAEWKVSRAPAFLFLIMAVQTGMFVEGSDGVEGAWFWSSWCVWWCWMAWLKRNEFAVKGVW